jgi:hypothetical protein
VKKILALVFGGLALVTVSASPASAHQSGCHRWHSCPSDSGSYVCGDTGYTNYCPTGGGSVETPTTVPYVYDPPTTTTTVRVTTTTAPRATTTSAAKATTTTLAPTTTTTTAEPEVHLDSQQTGTTSNEENSGNPVPGFLLLGGIGYGGYRLRRRAKARSQS